MPNRLRQSLENTKVINIQILRSDIQYIRLNVICQIDTSFLKFFTLHIFVFQRKSHILHGDQNLQNIIAVVAFEIMTFGAIVRPGTGNIYDG